MKSQCNIQIVLIFVCYVFKNGHSLICKATGGSCEQKLHNRTWVTGGTDPKTFSWSSFQTSAHTACILKLKYAGQKRRRMVMDWDCNFVHVVKTCGSFSLYQLKITVHNGMFLLIWKDNSDFESVGAFSLLLKVLVQYLIAKATILLRPLVLTSMTQNVYDKLDVCVSMSMWTEALCVTR